ncbi:hypothetical protein Tco_1095674 [Tanacetum coccineum]
MVHLIHILNCFHDVSCLKINLRKSRLFGIRVSVEEVVNIARAVNCSNDSLPFSYLGLLIGRNMNKIDAWSDVVQKFTNRLSSWKANLLSISGRLTLVKSILGTLPLYYLSLFKAPEAVISHLESIRRRFFGLKTLLFYGNGNGDSSMRVMLYGEKLSLKFTVRTEALIQMVLLLLKEDLGETLSNVV